MTNKYDNNQYTAVYLLQLLFRNQTIKEISMLSLETYRNRHLGMANESARQTACVCLQAHAGRLKQAEHGERIACEAPAGACATERTSGHLSENRSCAQ